MAVVDVRFANWQELIDYSKSDLPAASRKWCGDRVHRDMSYSSFNGETLETCWQLLRDGWTDRLAETQAISARLVDRITTKMVRDDIVYDTEGAQIDIARFCEGEPECWQRFEPTIVDGVGNRILKLAFDICVSSSVERESIINLGIRLSALVECLELAGYRVEITVMVRLGSRIANGVVWFDMRAILKEADQPLDMGRLLFAFAHDSMLRRVVFDVVEHQPVEAMEHRTSNSLMGIPQTTIEPGYDIFIAGRYVENGMNEAQAEAWISEQLRSNGIELN